MNKLSDYIRIVYLGGLAASIIKVAGAQSIAEGDNIDETTQTSLVSADNSSISGNINSMLKKNNSFIPLFVRSTKSDERNRGYISCRLCLFGCVSALIVF